jgi:phage terminase small subunit
MIRGTKPKPVELRIIEGNKSRRPLPDRAPTATGSPAKPKWLRGTGARLWAEYAPLLPWLGRVDSETLAAWCALSAEFQRNPENMNAARISQMRVLAAELGMTPSARTRLIAPHEPKEPSKYFA